MAAKMANTGTGEDKQGKHLDVIFKPVWLKQKTQLTLQGLFVVLDRSGIGYTVYFEK